MDNSFFRCVPTWMSRCVWTFSDVLNRVLLERQQTEDEDMRYVDSKLKTTQSFPFFSALGPLGSEFYQDLEAEPGFEMASPDSVQVEFMPCWAIVDDFRGLSQRRGMSIAIFTGRFCVVSLRKLKAEFLHQPWWFWAAWSKS